MTRYEGQLAKMRTALILPARNEAQALGQVLAEIPWGLIDEVIVVDNGSTDGSGDIARNYHAVAGDAKRRSLPPAADDADSAARRGRQGRAAAGPATALRVITEPIIGYGRACLAGIGALGPSIDTVVFMDADHSDYPGDLPKLLEPIAQGRADLVIGSRVALAQPGSLTIQQCLGNRLACALLRRLFGVRYADLGPFRAIRRSALEGLDMRDRTFGWTVEMQAKAARQRLRVAEVAVRYRPRIGRSKISGTITGTVRAGVVILTTIIRIAVTRGSSCVVGGSRTTNQLP